MAPLKYLKMTFEQQQSTKCESTTFNALAISAPQSLLETPSTTKVTAASVKRLVSPDAEQQKSRNKE
jgi:hypothetical protein